MEDKKWKYCAVGNIKKSHIDDNGIIRYGTPAFTGGTKVYLCGKVWDRSHDQITVIGLSRRRKYQVIDTKIELIENVRCGKVYRKRVLDIMSDYEFWHCWWGNEKEDKEGTAEFAEWWNNR